MTSLRRDVADTIVAYAKAEHVVPAAVAHLVCWLNAWAAGPATYPLPDVWIWDSGPRRLVPLAYDEVPPWAAHAGAAWSTIRPAAALEQAVGQDARQLTDPDSWFGQWLDEHHPNAEDSVR